MAMKSISHGTVSSRMRSAMKKTAPFSTPTRTRSRPRARRSATGSHPPRSGSRRPRSRAPRASFPGIFPCADGVFPTRRVHDAGNGHDLVTGDDERPLVSLPARNLRVDEHVLDLLRTTGQAVAGPARADDEARAATL